MNQEQFMQWIKTVHPRLFAASIRHSRGDGLFAAAAEGWFDSFLSSVQALSDTYINVSTQQAVLEQNINAAQLGIPIPPNGSAAQRNLPPSSGINYIYVGGAVIAAVGAWLVFKK